MAAPIQRYSDPRLFGSTFVKPFDHSYEWIRTVTFPIHPKANVLIEVSFKVMKAVTGVFAVIVTFVPALIGRAAQIIDYHSLSDQSRNFPNEISVDNMVLPALHHCQLPAATKFHGTSRESAINILRWGFDPSKTRLGAKMAEAVYISANDYVSVNYGEDQLIVSLDLLEKEVAYVNDSALGQLTLSSGTKFDEKRLMTTIRELYYQNGYRAIKYDLAHRFGKEEAWAVYDPSCITILSVKPSPVINEPLENAIPQRQLLLV